MNSGWRFSANSGLNPVRTFRRYSALLRYRLNSEIQQRVQIVRREIKHLSGREKVPIGNDEVVVVCMIRDGVYYLDEMLRHHRDLGASHFVFVDNGSKDGTVEYLSEQKDVTLVEVLLPVRRYESQIRVEAAKSIVEGGWLLFVDADEQHCFPYSDGRSISDYLRYCNERSYTSVISHVLDMYSDRTLRETSMIDYSESVRLFDQYSLSDIDAYDYFDQSKVSWSWFLRNNRLALDELKILFGGVRRSVFNEYCCLTTHRLVRNREDIIMFPHPHCMGNVNCADFTGLIKHYKFCGDFRSREELQFANGTWEHGEDAQRVDTLARNPDLKVTSDETHQLVAPEQLLRQGFLAASNEFLEEFGAD